MNKAALILFIIAISGAIMLNFSSQESGVDISISEFKELVAKEPGVIIDVRTKREYDNGHLKKTDHLFDFLTGEFHEKIDGLDKDETYYLYCRTGNRSGQAARIMKELGYEKVYNVGGFDELSAAGFEAEK
jgi:phage shock protein E